MDIVIPYLKVAIDFLFFTFSAKIMILSAISTFVLSILQRFLFSSQWDRAGTNILGFPIGVGNDQSIFEMLFECLFVICVYFAVYAACLVGWTITPSFIRISYRNRRQKRALTAPREGRKISFE
jgi:hypothetical protein